MSDVNLKNEKANKIGRIAIVFLGFIIGFVVAEKFLF